MSASFKESRDLLNKWEVNNTNILSLVEFLPPDKRFELLGWVYKNLSPSADAGVMEDKLKTYYKEWESSLYQDQIDNRKLEIKASIDPPSVEEGAYKCNKCSSMRTVSISRQTRGGDEGMTNFIRCVDCGKRWKE